MVRRLLNNKRDLKLLKNQGIQGTSRYAIIISVLEYIFQTALFSVFNQVPGMYFLICGFNFFPQGHRGNLIFKISRKAVEV